MTPRRGGKKHPVATLCGRAVSDVNRELYMYTKSSFFFLFLFLFCFILCRMIFLFHSNAHRSTRRGIPKNFEDNSPTPAASRHTRRAEEFFPFPFFLLRLHSGLRNHHHRHQMIIASSSIMHSLVIIVHHPSSTSSALLHISLAPPTSLDFTERRPWDLRMPP